MRTILLSFAVMAVPVAAAMGQIETVWLSHRSNIPDKIVVNWETKEPGNSIVRFGAGTNYDQAVEVNESVTLHHVEIAAGAKDARCHYSVFTGSERSADASFKSYPTDALRIAVVADWQSKPDVSSIIRDDIHLLVTAGDNVDCLHRLSGVGVKDCTKPHSELLRAYPELFRTVPFMPALGNHDREIRPRGNKPPPEPVYDVDATAFRKLFDLPDDEWKWHFDVPDFDLRLIALDLNHISDQGTTWQTCHPLTKGSEQFAWYDKLTSRPRPGFLVTLQNERNASIRVQENGAWHEMFSRGTIEISGFGYFAERAQVGSFNYYNTSLGGHGTKYPDPQSKVFQSKDSYILLTLTRNPKNMNVKLKGLDGEVIDNADYQPADGK